MQLALYGSSCHDNLSLQHLSDTCKIVAEDFTLNTFSTT